ncbi:FxLYD domain-containing protein [uncultured Methanoregula sp.]|uniref:FxLYD domain-containing protein n=1 Tax=uncultured Methanoregula sp. TaxID=1005933 RepID=UPI002AABD97C|nr:FxLYD domain-containing protein [uncultured Methanoregula sp.]
MAKERFQRLHTVYIILGLLVAGILICFLVIASPMLHYFIPMDNPKMNAGSPDTSSPSTPDFSMDSFLGSAGMDASTNLKIMSSELHRDGSNSWVAGKIKNTSNETYKGFTIYFNLYDSKGKSIGSTYVLMGELAAGDTKEFRTNPSKGMASSARLKYIIGSS